MSVSSVDDYAVECLGTVPPSHPALPPLFKEEECDSQSSLSACDSRPGDAESNTEHGSHQSAFVPDSDHDSGRSSDDESHTTSMISGSGNTEDGKSTDAANSVVKEKNHRFLHESQVPALFRN